MNATKVIGFTSAVIMMAAAIVVLSGLFLPPHLPKQVRFTFGIVLALWGVYRFVTTKMKSSPHDDSDQ